MPPVISLFEHQSCTFEEIGLHPKDAARRERVLEQIERINQSAGQEILAVGRKGLQARSMVGLLRAGPFTFEILPKIDDLSKADTAAGSPARSATRNLLAMLSYAWNLRLYEQENTGLAQLQHEPWFELLTRLFALQLARQAQAGLTHNYVQRQENLPVLRGRWDVQRQIRTQGASRHIFAVHYDDLSADHPLNQVFRFVIERLLFTSQNAKNRAVLQDLQAWFSPVTHLTEVPPALLDSIHFNRLNERYQTAFQLARLFLSGSSVQLSAGSLPACAFVFDMNQLFERFVAGFLQQHQQSILPEVWQGVRILPQSAGARIYLARSDDREVIRLRPDLLLLRPDQAAPLLIADTKYKRLSTAFNTGADPDDIYQMLAYIIRFGGAAPGGAPPGLLLYPQNGPRGALRKQITIEPDGQALFLATLNLNTPLYPPQPLIEALRDLFQWIQASNQSGRVK